MQFKIFQKFGDNLLHVFSNRLAGNLGFGIGDDEENVKENYRRFCQPLGIDPEKLVVSKQVHGDDILILKSAGENSEMSLDKLPGYDAFITDIQDMPLSVRFADCQGVLIFDPVKKVIAAIHCGWRGNVLNILGKTVLKMIENFGCNPVDLLVGISPAIGPCCAEFTDPLSELPEFMQRYVNEKNCVDLWQCSLDQLKEVDVLAENVEISKTCTCCNKDLFFSYRRDKGNTGRMAAIIALKS